MSLARPFHARITPYSSVVGQSIVLLDPDKGHVVAQLAVMAPNGPPPGEAGAGETHRAYVERIAQLVAEKLER